MGHMMVVLASQISLLVGRPTSTAVRNTHKLTTEKKRFTDGVNRPHLAGVHREEAVEEDQNAHQGRGDQHAGVPAQPRKIKTDLLPKIPPGGGGDRGQNSLIDGAPC